MNLNEKLVVTKRKYTDLHPSHVHSTHAPVRSVILDAIQKNGGIIDNKTLVNMGVTKRWLLDNKHLIKMVMPNNYKLTDRKASVFYMIQEMESWFISQPAILDDFYGEPISAKLAKKPAAAFTEPDKELQRLTKSNKKRGEYHKVRHGAQLLKMLDANKLYNDFSDFKRLIDALK